MATARLPGFGTTVLVTLWRGGTGSAHDVLLLAAGDPGWRLAWKSGPWKSASAGFEDRDRDGVPEILVKHLVTLPGQAGRLRKISLFKVANGSVKPAGEIVEDAGSPKDQLVRAIDLFAADRFAEAASWSVAAFKGLRGMPGRTHAAVIAANSYLLCDKPDSAFRLLRDLNPRSGSDDLYEAEAADLLMLMARLEFDGFQPIVWCKKAEVALKNGQADRAIESGRRLASTAALQERGTWILAEAYASKGLKNEARDQYRQLIAGFPSGPFAPVARQRLEELAVP